MPRIEELTHDLKELLKEGSAGRSLPIGEDHLTQLGVNVAQSFAKGLRDRTPETNRGLSKRLYASEIGTQCVRQLWYKLYCPEIGEVLPPHAIFKFIYGNVLEDMVLQLCRIAGHCVSDEQKPAQLSYDGWVVRGRRDATIDGHVVDVKSASPFGYAKIKEGLSDDNDTFGYRAQVSFYLEKGVDAGCGILAVDKQNGHISYHETEYIDPEEKLASIVPLLTPTKTPPRAFKPVAMANGSEQLCVECSYCPFKKECWNDANKGKGLMVAGYANKPVFLTNIAKPSSFRVPLTLVK